MIRAYKYRIYPTSEQKTLIDKTIGCCRFVFNLALEVKIRAWKECGHRLSSFDLCYQLADLKKECQWLNEVDSQALQAAVKKIDVAFKNFYRGNGYPKFKSKRNGGSFQCPSNTRRVDWKNSTITIPKIKNIPIILSRKFDGKIKTVTISRTATGKYFTSILVETNDVLCTMPDRKNAVGIDLGITAFATLSTGEKIENPKYLRLNTERLKILQRRASRKKKGSNNRKKANLRVAAIHERINNQRTDFLNQLSTKLIRDNQTDTICVESLAVKNMVKNHNLAQAINDVSWSEFIHQLEYKGKWYGKNIIKIDRWFASSKICSNCGNKLDQLDLSIRKWTCSNCHSTHDRDINAAINIKNMGLQSAMGSRKVPVEMCSIEQSAKQETYYREV